MNKSYFLKIVTTVFIPIITILMSNLSIAAPSAPSLWIACGSQGGSCFVNTAKPVMIRYGDETKNNYLFFSTEGVERVKCDNFIGNPSDGDSKRCWYNEAADGISDQTKWTTCAEEGDNCSTNHSNPVWVRYGDVMSRKWLYTQQSGTISCSDSYFGWDPVKGTKKVCQLGEPVHKIPPKWTTCATEGQTCDLSAYKANNTGITLRYGNKESWKYFTAVQQSEIKCNNSNFGDPIKGVNKICQFTTYTATPIVSYGRWKEVVNCRGVDCGTDYSVTWGSSWSSSITNTDTWSVGVTRSISAGVMVPPAEVSSSVSISAEYANSHTYQKSLEDSFGKTTNVSCTNDTGSSKVKTIYQFSTGSEASCLTGDGRCVSSTNTQNFICYAEDEPLPTRPICLPNACVDVYCTECTYPTN